MVFGSKHILAWWWWYSEVEQSWCKYHQHRQPDDIIQPRLKLQHLRVSCRHLFWNTFRQKKSGYWHRFSNAFFSENKHIILSFGDTLFFGALQLFTAKEFTRRKKKVTGVLRTNHHQQEGTILLCRRCKRVFTLIMP